MHELIHGVKFQPLVSQKILLHLDKFTKKTHFLNTLE